MAHHLLGTFARNPNMTFNNPIHANMFAIGVTWVVSLVAILAAIGVLLNGLACILSPALIVV